MASVTKERVVGNESPGTLKTTVKILAVSVKHTGRHWRLSSRGLDYKIILYVELENCNWN